ncbi:MAG: glucosyl-3-phosphoglycerate synthase [Actinomycetota bacterium]
MRPTVGVILPARNEAETVGAIVHAIARDLADLVDRIIVVDDGSVDATPVVAELAGARVVPSRGGPGKGQAMRAGVDAITTDIVVFCDADLYEFESHFVTRLVEPLLHHQQVQFVKAVYRRPLGDRPDEGGRVTELVARPLLSLLYPELEHVVQPLGGEYAGRRSVFEAIPFDDGYGVDVGLLIDVAERFGVDAIAQVDLGVRLHRNRPLRQLVPQARAVMAAVLERADGRSPTAPAPRGARGSD